MAGRGGRGGRGGGSASRQIATALGIPIHEMANFMRQRTADPPPRYPQIQRSLIPLEMNIELCYIAEFKAEFKTRFLESPFFLDEDEAEKKDIRRYTDKYKSIEREKFTPDFARLPDELCYEKKKEKKDGSPQKKKRKLNEDEAKDLTAKLTSLEEKEKGEDSGDESEEEEEESEGEAAEGAGSEEDGEEDNDYITSYFDNGEGYGEGGSDDNLDGDGDF